MLPTLILPETVMRQDGASEDIALENSGRLVQLTLGITRILEQESLEVSVWGSADKEEWRQLAAFPQKFYCGTYALSLDLTNQADVRYLRVHWKMGRWTNRESAPLFGFYLRAEEGRLTRHAAA
jgi:hypothetical protein